MESQPDSRLPGSSTPGLQTAAAEGQRPPETNGGPAGPKVVEPLPGAPPPQPPADERVRTLSTFHRVMGRPESASIAGPS